MIKIKQNINALVRGIIISIAFILLSFQNFHFSESVEKFLYGIEMRFALSPPAGAGKISMVNIDNKSIEKLGPWPWPRSYLAVMIEKLNDSGARLIGLDLDGLDHREQNQGLKEIKKLSSFSRISKSKYYCCNCVRVTIFSGEESIYDSSTFGSLICKQVKRNYSIHQIYLLNLKQLDLVIPTC